MSISSEINRIKTNIANAYTQANEKGATLPEQQNSANLASTISSISGGGGLNIQHGIIPKAVDEDGYVKDIEIEGIETVEQYKFYNDTKLQNVEFAEGVTTINDSVFQNCSNLKNVKLTTSLTSIGENVFLNCDNIEKFEPFNGRTHDFKAYAVFSNNILIEGTYISNRKRWYYDVVKYPPKKEDSEFTFTNLYKVFNAYSFQNCKNLTSLKINSGYAVSNSEFYIKANAFSGCTNLSRIIITNIFNLSNINAFEGTPIGNGEGYIYVTDSLVDTYKSKTNWSTFANQIKPLSELE